ncbi:MAG: DUF4185 domain-containing protein, partial [Planctomycetota bacterium]
LTSLEPGYEGWLWIRTANDDKTVADDAFISFTLGASAVVAVGYDKRATELPGWLQGWQRAPWDLETNDGGASPLNVYYRTFGAAASVVLGGNMAQGAAGAGSMYVVLVLPEAELQPTAVGVTPSQATAKPGETVQFSAAVVDQVGQAVAGSGSVEWSASGGTIDADGLFTAGSTAGRYTVTARATASGLTGTATIEITGTGGNGEPYSPSPVIASVSFDFATHDRRAPGSDNWPVTWSDNDHQYTAWGDGGGFGGTNSDGRVSLGIARIEGSATSHTGYNVWGGKNPENQATFGGKSYGILSVDGVLYMWVSPGSGPTGYQEARLYRSTNHGAFWTKANWAFVKAEGLINPTFLQFGRDYADARDGYVYSYANHLKDGTDLAIQQPGEIALMRVPKNQVMDRNAYEFFAGTDAGGNPIWTSDLAERRPVFEDAKGVGWNTSASYNAGIGRYLLITEHAESFAGNIGIFDAPEPWGPWSTALYAESFGAPAIDPNTFFWNFSNKWLSTDGKSFTLVFTGIGSNDSWNTVRGTLQLR